MKIITKKLEFITERSSVVTLGKFDGIHRGHKKLIDRVLAVGEQENLETIVFTFDVSPAVSLEHQKAQMILTAGQRRKYIESLGIQTMIEYPFVPEVMCMEAEVFIRKILVEQLQAKVLVVGPDYHFGHGRRGDTKMLQRMGKEYGFRVEVVDKVMAGIREISSTYVREELKKGNMEKVNALLGYTYCIEGEIIHGHQLGRTIGVPTINQIPDIDKLVPPRGVYATRTEIDGQMFCGITNIGVKPTVPEKFVGVETYLFDCNQNLYGKKAKVYLYHFQRPEKRFESLEALKRQLALDEQHGRKYFEASERMPQNIRSLTKETKKFETI